MMKRRDEPWPLSQRSEERLAGVDPQLQTLVREVLYYLDVSVIEGLRSVETQKEYVRRGVSKTMASKHLTGKAIDLYPYPVPRTPEGEIDSAAKEWDQMALVVFYCAGKLGIEGLEWGGLWESLIDKPHFQLT